MDDAELEEIRAKRMAQLRSQFAGDMSGERREQAEEREQQAKEMRNSILSQILDQSARARRVLTDSDRWLSNFIYEVLRGFEDLQPPPPAFHLLRVNTLMIGKPEKGRMAENTLIQMAQAGRLPGKISEPELIKILESINQQTTKTTTIKFDRRRAALDDSDDDL